MNINDYIGGELEYTVSNGTTFRGTIEKYEKDQLRLYEETAIHFKNVSYLGTNSDKWQQSNSPTIFVPIPNNLEGIALSPTSFQIAYNDITFTFYHPNHPEHLTPDGITLKQPQPEPSPKYRSIDAKD